MTSLREALKRAIPDVEKRSLDCSGYRTIWLEEAELNYAQRRGFDPKNMAAMGLHMASCKDPVCHSLHNEFNLQLKRAQNSHEAREIITKAHNLVNPPEEQAA